MEAYLNIFEIRMNWSQGLRAIIELSQLINQSTNQSLSHSVSWLGSQSRSVPKKLSGVIKTHTN
jgi:hypothetical protein